MKGWKLYALAAAGLLLLLGAGWFLFLRYFPAYDPAYLAWQKENPGAPRLEYEAQKAGRKNSDGGGKGSSLRS